MVIHQVWDPTISDEEMDKRLREVGQYFPTREEHQNPTPTPSVIVAVTPENISKAKAFIGNLNALAGESFQRYPPFSWDTHSITQCSL